MKKNNVLNFIIVFLMVAIIGVLAFMLLKPGDEETPTPTPTPTIEPTVEPTVEPTPEPTPIQNEELALADEVKVNKSNIKLTKGQTETFAITVNGVAGLIEVNSSDSNIVKVSTNSDECNETKCFFDAPTGSSSTVEYTVTGVENGTANINIVITDLLTYEEVPVNGSGSINVSVE